MAEFKFEGGRWSFSAPDGAGWFNMGFALNDIRADYETWEVPGGLDAIGQGQRWREELTFRWNADQLTIRRVVANTGDQPLALVAIVDGKLDPDASVTLPRQNEYTVRYVHSSNMRTEKFPRSRPEYPYVRPMPYQGVEFGCDEGNQFPAFIVCDEDYQTSLVEGELNQTQFLRVWKVGLDCYQATQRHPLAADFVLKPGERVEVSHVFYQLLRGAHPQDAFKGYVEELNRLHDFQGKRSPMLHGAVFCTWNYGTLHNIDEKLLLGRAAALRERVPECSHFLIDDGYQKNRGKRNGPLDCFYPDLDCDRERFPKGMKHLADELKQLGLTPCVWLSPSVHLDSALAEEHPEWLLRGADGEAGLLGKTTYLDLSVDAARGFFLKVLDTLLVDWGFRGVKFDFMTHWFTLEKARFRNGGSGPQWRDWAFAEIRKRVGPDGLLMTCIAMSMGNPFPGLNADCYRCGCDIHGGAWPEQLKACKATLPQLLLEGRRTFLLNMDSAGFGDVPEHEQLFRLTWVFITQGIIELGGPAERMTERQITLWRKLLANADRGHKVRCLDKRAFTGDGFPEILKVEYPFGGRMANAGVKAHLAFFNWSGEAVLARRSREALGVSPEDSLLDYWTGEELPSAPMLGFELGARSARLLELS